MSGKNVNFRDKEILKSGFYKNKKVIKINDIDVNKKLVSKYFIRYNDKNFIRPLCKKLPQMIAYVRKFEGNTTMSF